MFFHILPFIEEQALFDQSKGNVNSYWPTSNQSIFSHLISTYTCPSDASFGEGLWTDAHPDYAFGNYGVNFQVFGNPDAGDNATNMRDSSLWKKTFVDGASKTITYCEKKARCGVPPGSPIEMCTLWGSGNWLTNQMAIFAHGSRDGGTGYYTANWWGGDSGKVGPTSVFQTPLSIQDCSPTFAHSNHNGAMPAGLADGSVRWLASEIDGAVWWAACTPKGNETMPSDW